MLKFGNKEFRNLQEQVKKNMDDIMFILQEEGVLNEFGIKVVGQEESVIDMPTVDNYKEDNPDWEYGDAYAVGTEAPYELYILTRANGTHPDDYWFNIGEFPMPGPQGEQGPEGEQGPQGQTGPSGQDGISPEFSIGTVSATTLSASESATASVTQSGTYAQPILNFEFGIPQGQDGSAVTSVNWGDISGSIENQTDLVSALQGKANASDLSLYAKKGLANAFMSTNEFFYDVSFYSKVYLTSNVICGENIKLGLYGSIRWDSSTYMTNDLDGGFGIYGALSLNNRSGSDFYKITLPYASGVVALQNDIPTISGTYSDDYWTTITIGNTTKSVGQGGGNAQWGFISGTLSDQLDLMSKFSEYAKVEDIPSLSGYATESYVLSQLSDYATISSLSIYAQTSSLASVAFTGNYSDLNGLPTIPSDTGDLTNGAGFITSSALTPYATVSALSSAVSDITSVISSLDYASVGALSSGALNGYATESWVLSKSYASVGDLPNMSLYAELSKYNNFTNSVNFNSFTTFASTARIYGNTTMDGDIYVQVGKSIYGEDGANLYTYSWPSASGRLALQSEIPSLSEYATISAVSSAISSAVSSINSTISSLNYLSVGALSSATVIYGTGVEVWTFTLSDNTSVSKTVVLG